MTEQTAQDEIRAGTIRIPGGDGDSIEAYHATPSRPDARGSLVVVHHLPGYDEQTKEITRRFAVEGFQALCPNLYSREAPGLSVKDAAAKVRGDGGVPDDQVVADIRASADYLRGPDGAGGKVGVIGYCSGGRQAVLAACQSELDAVVDCYGAFVMHTAGEETGLPRVGFPELIPDLSCPVLGLFGAEDPAPSLEEVRDLEDALKANGKEYEFHVYEEAGHAFFSTDSLKYRPKAALAGWDRIVDFCNRHLR
jgi:carboxymethylenebutenolidase